MSWAVALDLGSTTGWASCERPGDAPRLGHFVLRGPTPEAKGLALWRELHGLFGTLRPERVVYEAPLVSAEGRSHETAVMLIGFAFMAGAMAAHHKCRDIATVHNQSVKKWFAGSGRAQKGAMVRECLARGWRPANEHEADAAAVLAFFTESERERLGR